MNILVFNLLVIMLLPALNLFEGEVKIVCKSRQTSSSFQAVRLIHFSYTFLINYVRTHARSLFVCPLRMSFGLENKYYLFNTLSNNYNF